MAGRQARSESHNHLQFIGETQADLGASAWPAEAPRKKRADSAADQYQMTWCTTALQNRPPHAGSAKILRSAVLRLWKGLTQGPGTPSRHLAMPHQCTPKAQMPGVTTDWERQDQQILSQEVPPCKGIQYDTRQREMPGSMPKARVSTASLPYCLADLVVQLLYLYLDPG